MERLTKKEIAKKLDLALLQYHTIDRDKHEHFPVIQGFAGYMIADRSTAILPFHIYQNEDKEKIVNAVHEVSACKVGFSLAQHYIHYGG